MTYVGAYSQLGISLAAGGPAADQARAQLAAALKASEGRVGATAALLGLHRTTVMRLIQAAGLAPFASDLRRAHDVPGPLEPLGQTNITDKPLKVQRRAVHHDTE